MIKSTQLYVWNLCQSESVTAGHTTSENHRVRENKGWGTSEWCKIASFRLWHNSQRIMREQSMLSMHSDWATAFQTGSVWQISTLHWDLPNTNRACSWEDWEKGNKPHDGREWIFIMNQTIHLLMITWLNTRRLHNHQSWSMWSGMSSLIICQR